MLQGELAPRVLFVGGLDPSGSAGLLADVKTAQEYGVFAAAAATAVTAQNRFGVSDLSPMSGSLLGAQLDAAWADAPFDVVKSGMLVNVDLVQALAHRIQSWGTPTRLIVDPVLRSTTGRSLLDEDGRRALLRTLLPKAALITPNLLEAEELTGRPAMNVDDMSSLADHFLAMGANAVLIKGGHLVERDPSLIEVVDLLRTLDGEEFRLRRPRLKPVGSRGTGCTLASAIACGLAEGLTLHSAVENAQDFVHQALLGSGVHGAVGALDLSARRHKVEPTQ